MNIAHNDIMMIIYLQYIMQLYGIVLFVLNMVLYYEISTLSNE